MNKFPKCPHCGYEFDDEETWFSSCSENSQVYIGDGDESDVICHNDDCEKSFKIECTHVTMFNCVPLEN